MDFQYTAGSILVAYLAIAFAKACLMLPSLPVVVGVHYRLLRRRGEDPSFPALFAMLLGALIFSSLTNVFHGLRDEGLRYFVMYSKRKVIRDSVQCHFDVFSF